MLVLISQSFCRICQMVSFILLSLMFLSHPKQLFLCLIFHISYKIINSYFFIYLVHIFFALVASSSSLFGYLFTLFHCPLFYWCAAIKHADSIYQTTLYCSTRSIPPTLNFVERICISINDSVTLTLLNQNLDLVIHLLSPQLLL